MLTSPKDTGSRLIALYLIAATRTTVLPEVNVGETIFVSKNFNLQFLIRILTTRINLLEFLSKKGGDIEIKPVVQYVLIADRISFCNKFDKFQI